MLGQSMKTPNQSVAGFFMLEALIAILIFSLGLLGLVAMQGAAISAQSDAQYRAEAAKFANEMLSSIWVNVTRLDIKTDATGAATKTSLAEFAHQPSGTDCVFSGAAASNPLVSTWANRVIATGANGGLPGATTALQQIRVDTSTAGLNKVTITICWQAPQDKAPRKHIAIGYIN
jgi:type IV pilus assembly protein PilV